ncbi:hypothetical protein Tco_0039675 [Tanacetum coccineum]
MEESGDEATSRLRIHGIWKKMLPICLTMSLSHGLKKRRKCKPQKRRNNPSPIAKCKLMGKVTNPTTYVVNKSRIVLNEGSDKGKSKMVKDANTVKKAVEKCTSKLVEDANTVKKVVDKGKSKIVEEDRPVHFCVRMNNGINYTLYSDSDSDSEYLDKSVDYLSEGEDELIELRKRKSEAKNAPKVRKQQTQAAKEGISSAVRQKKKYVVGDNGTIIEHEGFMDDLLKKTSQDNGNGMTS